MLWLQQCKTTVLIITANRVHPSPVCAEAAVFPCSQSSPHTSLWHVDSIIARGSLQGRTEFFETTPSPPHTDSLCFFRSSFQETFCLSSPRYSLFLSTHITVMYLPPSRCCFSSPILSQKGSHYSTSNSSSWSYNTDSKSKRHLFLSRDRWSQLKKKKKEQVDRSKKLEPQSTRRRKEQTRSCEALWKHYGVRRIKTHFS